MLQKKKSTSKALFKLAFLLPIILGSLIFTACTQEIENQEDLINDSLKSGTLITNDEYQKFVEWSREKEFKGTIKVPLEDETSITNNEYQEFVDWSRERGLKGTIKVPLNSLDTSPIYPDCTGTNEEIKECLQIGISNTVNQNFNVDEFKDNIGNHKILVKFIIDTNGNIKNVESKAESKAMEQEAQRVVELLPQMQPGMVRNKKVDVIYTLPIKFQIKE